MVYMPYNSTFAARIRLYNIARGTCGVSFSAAVSLPTAQWVFVGPHDSCHTENLYSLDEDFSFNMFINSMGLHLSFSTSLCFSVSFCLSVCM